MISYLIDINVWLALTWDQHVLHRSAARWFSGKRDATFLFCRFTMLGFLRLLTNRKVMGNSVITIAGAVQLYDEWLQDPRVEFAPEPLGVEEQFREELLQLGKLHATNAVADCYLLGFAQAAGVHLGTFDTGLAARARRRGIAVTLIHAAGPRLVPPRAREQ